MESIWQKEITRPVFPTLDGDIRTDVLIIGGGITGILCGHMLKSIGIDCVIAEAKTVCGGVTENTTAKITAQHGAIYDKMIRRYGFETAGLYLKAQNDAIDEYRKLSRKIPCDFTPAPSYVYSRTDRETIEKEVAALEKLGCAVSFTTDTELPFPIVGAVMMKNQAQFHPLKLLYALSEELPIFENTEILQITPDGARTRHGMIKAQKSIVATHFPLLNKHGLYFAKMYQHRSYVLALKNAQNMRGMYVDTSDKGLSFRGYGDLLLLGGGGHRTGKQGGGYRELRDFAAAKYPASTEICHYATQDCKTLDDIPYIGRYTKSLPNVYVATGFNKWGMTSAMVAAKILRDFVAERENEYAPVFSPSRSMLHKQLLINVGESICGLLTPTVPRCTHLGCALKYNRQEHSWDCSCHGSRFTADGRVIDNPATRDIRVNKKR